jgi:deoxyguanosine kinase
MFQQAANHAGAVAAKFPYIVVEGPIGAGKTSLARRLAQRLESELLLENPDDNPFLARFYRDMRRYAFQTQMFFLFQRVTQLRDLKQHELFKQSTVADFMLEKDPLFAQLTLTDDEFRLYQQVYQHLAPQAPTPDLVIYLQAPVDVLAGRVDKRGNKSERSISEDYLRKLAESYIEFFYRYDRAPLLIVNSENLNFVDRERDLDLLIERMRNMRGKREFFNRGG